MLETLRSDIHLKQVTDDYICLTTCGRFSTLRVTIAFENQALLTSFVAGTSGFSIFGFPSPPQPIRLILPPYTPAQSIRLILPHSRTHWRSVGWLASTLRKKLGVKSPSRD